MSRYETPTILAPVYIDDRAPLGLVRRVGNQRVEHFCICEHEELKWAIALPGPNAGPEYLAWRLDGSAQDWFGLFLGEIEVEVDVERCISGLDETAKVGQVFIRDGDFFIKVRTESPLQTLSLRIGRSAQVGVKGSSVSFPIWRLIKRDGLKEKTVLFSSGSETAG